MKVGRFIFYVGLLLLVAVIVGNTFTWRGMFAATYGSIAERVDGEEATTPERPGITFTGDVMLAREVEQYMSRYGSSYPFAIFSSFPKNQYTFINFEAAVPKEHEPTEAFAMKFSVAKENLLALKNAGVTHASLANNHSYDYGGAGYLSSVENLLAVGIIPFGHPREVTDITVTYVELDTATVAVIGITPLEHSYTNDELSALVSEAAKHSDLQVVYIHWGVEYEAQHGDSQAALAHQLIDLGVDLIVGHHPHVVEDLEVYKGKLIFYSLGNLIFDQYFSTEVQAGLVLSLQPNEQGYLLSLLPVSTADSRIQPRLMTGYERDNFLTDLAQNSDKTLATAIKNGVVQLDVSLAY